MNALPNWLSTGEPRLTNLSVIEESYENFFVTVVQEVTKGRPVTHVISDDPRGIDVGAYLRWIHKDAGRKRQYYEARAIGAAAVEDELLAIADAEDSSEDVQRSTLRINTRKWLLGVWDRKRYGDTKQVDVTNDNMMNNLQITFVAAGQQPQLERVIDGDIVSR